MAEPTNPPANPPAPGVDPGNPPVNNQDPPANPAANNDANAQRRIIETLQRKIEEIEKRVPGKPADPPAGDPKPGDPPPADKALLERLAAIERELVASKTEALRNRIAAEAGIPAEHIDLIEGADEAAMRERAKRLAPLVANAPKPPAPPAGTVTKPANAGGPTVEQRLVEAEKAGDTYAIIRIKREAAGLTQPAE